MKLKPTNCRVLGTSRDEADYITTATPMQTKKKQMLSAKEAGLDATREKSVTKARRGGDVRPLHGGIAKAGE